MKPRMIPASESPAFGAYLDRAIPIADLCHRIQERIVAQHDGATPATVGWGNVADAAKVLADLREIAAFLGIRA